MEGICYVRNGDGPLGCHCAEPWDEDYGKFGPICQQSERLVFSCLHKSHLVALHGFIKKTRKTPDQDLELARKRKEELE